jgi:hypothetical protein
MKNSLLVLQSLLFFNSDADNNHNKKNIEQKQQYKLNIKMNLANIGFSHKKKKTKSIIR